MRFANIYDYPSIKDMSQYKRQVSQQKEDAVPAFADVQRLVEGPPSDEIDLSDVAKGNNLDQTQKAIEILALPNEEQIKAWAEFGLEEPGRLTLALTEIEKLANHNATELSLHSNSSKLASAALRKAKGMESASEARGHKLGTLVTLHSLVGKKPGLKDVGKCAAFALRILQGISDEGEAQEFAGTVTSTVMRYLRATNKELYTSVPYAQTEPTRLLLEMTGIGTRKTKDKNQAKGEHESGKIPLELLYEESLRAPAQLPIELPEPTFEQNILQRVVGGKSFAGRAQGSLESAREWANHFVSGEAPYFRSKPIKDDVEGGWLSSAWSKAQHWSQIYQEMEKEANQPSHAPRAQIAKAVYSGQRNLDEGESGWKTGSTEMQVEYLQTVAEKAGFEVAWQAPDMVAYQPPHAEETDPGMVVDANGNVSFVNDTLKAVRRDFDLATESVLRLNGPYSVESAAIGESKLDDVHQLEKMEELPSKKGWLLSSAWDNPSLPVGEIKYRALLEHALWSTWEAALEQPKV